jgi:hypothetical protein
MTPRKPDLDGPRPVGRGLVETGDPALEFDFGKEPIWGPNPDAVELYGPKPDEGSAIRGEDGEGPPIHASGEFEDEVPDPENAAIRIRPDGHSFAWGSKPLRSGL